MKVLEDVGEDIIRNEGSIKKYAALFVASQTNERAVLARHERTTRVNLGMTLTSLTALLRPLARIRPWLLQEYIQRNTVSLDG